MDKLRLFFPEQLLARARVVVVDRAPRPPLELWAAGAFDEVSDVPGASAAGITLGDTFFVKRGCEDRASLFFHELIHVIQWRRLGPNLFLALYGAFLLSHGYAASPLERMAYGMQAQFNGAGAVGFDAQSLAERRIDAIVTRFKRSSWANRLTVAALRETKDAFACKQHA